MFSDAFLKIFWFSEPLLFHLQFWLVIFYHLNFFAAVKLSLFL